MTRLEPNTFRAGMARIFLSVALTAAYFLPVGVNAEILGEVGSSFNLTAREGYVSIADGGSVYSWGYTSGGTMQLPGPTLIVQRITAQP